ncbi:MAG TPA: hypothetical protein VN735_08650 [Steroidobacteraceae bacterium]|nr:hypothetical protein [Steroidobacteraceae bacterium]
MSSPKPRIRPKADPYRQRSDLPLRDPPTHPVRDPPVFAEQDPGTKQKPPERVIFQEDDCLR